MSHIIGRPNDDLLDVMLGHGADPEQAFIDGSEQGLEEGDGFEDRLLGDEPTVPLRALVRIEPVHPIDERLLRLT